jgi:hypothetical protein
MVQTPWKYNIEFHFNPMPRLNANKTFPLCALQSVLNYWHDELLLHDLTMTVKHEGCGYVVS